MTFVVSEPNEPFSVLLSNQVESISKSPPSNVLSVSYEVIAVKVGFCGGVSDKIFDLKILLLLASNVSS